MNIELEPQGAEQKVIHPVFRVTTVSKYLALILFIFLPFLGGLVGYVYAPEKVIEVERVVKELEPKDTASAHAAVIDDVFAIDPTKSWSVSYATSSINLGDIETDTFLGLLLKSETTITPDIKEPAELEGLYAHQFTDTLRSAWRGKYEVVVDADGLPNRDLDVYRISDGYIQVKMHVNYANWSEDAEVESGSLQEAFGNPVSVSYEVFITTDPQRGGTSQASVPALEGSGVTLSSFEMGNGYVLEEFECDYIYGLEGSEDTCFRLLKVEGGKNIKIVEDVTTIYRNNAEFKKFALAKLFFPEGVNHVYFKSFVPNSSNCCSIVKFIPETLEFVVVGSISPYDGDEVSPSQQYIARVVDEGNALEIFDVPAESVVHSVQAGAGESFFSSYCGYGGAYSDLSWDDDTTLSYGTYVPSSGETQGCEPTLIEKRVLEVGYEAFTI